MNEQKRLVGKQPAKQLMQNSGKGDFPLCPIDENIRKQKGQNKKQRQIRCITFDFGGVYTPTSIMEDVFAAYDAKHGTDVKKFWSKVYGSLYWDDFFKGLTTEVEFFSRIKQAFGNPGFDGEFFGQCIKKESAKIDPRMQALVSRLKSMGYRTAMLTNNAIEWFEHLVRDGSMDGFEYVLTSYDLGMKKPDERIYKIMLRAVGVAGEECVFIDDLSRNTDAARKLGISTITFKSFEQASKELEEIIGIKL